MSKIFKRGLGTKSPQSKQSWIQVWKRKPLLKPQASQHFSGMLLLKWEKQSQNGWSHGCSNVEDTRILIYWTHYVWSCMGPRFLPGSCKWDFEAVVLCLLQLLSQPRRYNWRERKQWRLYLQPAGRVLILCGTSESLMRKDHEHPNALQSIAGLTTAEQWHHVIYNKNR